MFNNLSINLKVVSLLATLLIVAIGGAVFSGTRMQQINSDYSKLLEHHAPASVALARLNRGVVRIEAAIYRAASSVSETEKSAAKFMLDEALKHIDARAAELHKMVPEYSDRFEQQLTSLKQLLDTGVCSEVVRIALSSTNAEINAKAAAKMTSECMPALERIVEDLVTLTNVLMDQVKAIGQRVSEAANYTRWLSLILISGVGVVVLGSALILTRKSVVTPLLGMRQHMDLMSKGHLDKVVDNQNRKDEIGGMAKSLEIFRSQLAEIEKMRKDQLEEERRLAEQRRADVLATADRLQKAVGVIIDTVSSTSAQLEGAATVMQKAAGATQTLSAAVASASEQTSANVQGVASASEELSATVSEIGRQVQDSSQIANAAVKQAQETNLQMQELSNAANRIGDVVNLINTIAGQTNLLALNATIEAARAGDAGKGFAVVAQEVKTLAAQTAKATNEIASQIENMQSVTQKAVDVIQTITATIDRMSEISGAIASAVEEQDATTKEISRNVLEAAKGTSEVASNITDVSKGAEETGSASAQVLASAKQLSRESATLRQEIDDFLATLRAA